MCLFGSSLPFRPAAAHRINQWTETSEIRARAHKREFHREIPTTSQPASGTMDAKRSMYVPDYVAQFAKIKIQSTRAIRTTASLGNVKREIEMKWDGRRPSESRMERASENVQQSEYSVYRVKCDKLSALFLVSSVSFTFSRGALAPQTPTEPSNKSGNCLYICDIRARRWSEKCAFLHFFIFMDEMHRCGRRHQTESLSISPSDSLADSYS